LDAGILLPCACCAEKEARARARCCATRTAYSHVARAHARARLHALSNGIVGTRRWLGERRSRSFVPSTSLRLSAPHHAAAPPTPFVLPSMKWSLNGETGASRGAHPLTFGAQEKAGSPSPSRLLRFWIAGKKKATCRVFAHPSLPHSPAPPSCTATYALSPGHALKWGIGRGGAGCVWRGGALPPSMQAAAPPLLPPHPLPPLSFQALGRNSAVAAAAAMRLFWYAAGAQPERVTSRQAARAGARTRAPQRHGLAWVGPAPIAAPALASTQPTTAQWKAREGSSRKKRRRQAGTKQKGTGVASRARAAVTLQPPHKHIHTHTHTHIHFTHNGEPSFLNHARSCAARLRLALNKGLLGALPGLKELWIDGWTAGCWEVGV
jgi:hypothetical protein